MSFFRCKTCLTMKKKGYKELQKNEAKFEALGISRKVSSLRVLTQNTKNKNGRRRDEENYEEYNPKN